MANSSKTEIQINYNYGYIVSIFSIYRGKLHLYKSDAQKSLCNRETYVLLVLRSNIFKYYTYQDICKNCLKKLPIEILEKVKYNFILAKLKGTK